MLMRMVLARGFDKRALIRGFGKRAVMGCREAIWRLGVVAGFLTKSGLRRFGC